VQIMPSLFLSAVMAMSLTFLCQRADRAVGVLSRSAANSGSAQHAGLPCRCEPPSRAPLVRRPACAPRRGPAEMVQNIGMEMCGYPSVSIQIPGDGAMMLKVKEQVALLPCASARTSDRETVGNCHRAGPPDPAPRRSDRAAP